MTDIRIKMRDRKRIALVAHDHRKETLLDWVKFNQGSLSRHLLYATGTTGQIIEEKTGLPVQRLESGPLGGDQQIGAMIAENTLDFLFFYWDPHMTQPHDPDVKALLRLAVVWNIPVAMNRASADFLISSHLMQDEYDRLVPDYHNYRQRRIDTE
ncbi:MAG: methylglyoxal synthase [Leptonema sp. (in: Bacteria)]|nr:methylglyoxal synthase [Leptonema sp. (in: bacteria)]